ncbi:phosphatidylglycerol lysyltransferase domain-containing protein [Rhizobium helianthi]|uniref:Phosphatidylglycerol lysyltransferase domain-containing protein n=1 Tax=Rhizobium helianthi TaxID=1132695 RepID=A0ABW4M3L8_9HYPH
MDHRTAERDAAATNPTGFSTVLEAASGRGRFIRPLRFQPAHEVELDPEQVIDILGTQANASAGLALLGDKKLLLSSTGQCFIMYAVRGRSWVALFDPVGPMEHWGETVRLFMARARAAGCRQVFYQVSPRFLPLAIECGLVAHKLGEQAIVDLQRFELKGGDWLKLRRSINRAERDGLEFTWFPAEQVPQLLPELRSVSDQWLKAHNAAEKGFSLGTFQDDYLCKSPVAVIRLEGRIVAFASVMTASSEGDTFIDLMRHIPGTHRGMMDLLFVRIMEKLKADGYQTLNLGMAPLAGLSEHPCAPLWHRICRFVFEHGERLYNFRGVQSFKAKFDPDWQPRYLVVKGNGLPITALCDVTLLISGGLKGVFRR